MGWFARWRRSRAAQRSPVTAEEWSAVIRRFSFLQTLSADEQSRLRDLVAASRIALPDGLPPMSSGVFGVLGYDMVRLAERLPGVNPDPLDLPDAVMIRPSIVAVFDAIAQEIILVTTARPSPDETAAAAYAAARARIAALLPAAVKNKAVPVILVCKSGARSGRAVAIAKPEHVGRGGVEVRRRNAQEAAHDVAVAEQALHDVLGQVGRDGEAQADVAGHRAARVEAGGVDAYQLAVEVDQRATRVAHVDGLISGVLLVP